MDILQWLKMDHEAMLRSVDKLGSGPRGPLATLISELAIDLLGHLKAEEEYLLPELTDRFPGAEIILDLCSANQKIIRKNLKSMLKASSEKDSTALDQAIVELRKAVTQHLELQETQLMPKLRQHVPTGEREDLGLLVEDMLADVKAEGIDIVGELKGATNRSKAGTSSRARA